MIRSQRTNFQILTKLFKGIAFSVAAVGISFSESLLVADSLLGTLLPNSSVMENRADKIQMARFQTGL